MKWTDSSIFKGEWKRGIQNGIGLMVFANGEQKKGYFENNVFLGPAKPEKYEKRIKNVFEIIDSGNCPEELKKENIMKL
jgi:hypothetical protein